MKLLRHPVNLYFLHSTLTPGNVRIKVEAAWLLPEEGEIISGSFGYMDEEVSAVVTGLAPLSPYAYDVFIAPLAIPEPTGDQDPTDRPTDTASQD